MIPRCLVWAKGLLTIHVHPPSHFPQGGAPLLLFPRHRDPDWRAGTGGYPFSSGTACPRGTRKTWIKLPVLSTKALACPPGALQPLQASCKAPRTPLHNSASHSEKHVDLRSCPQRCHSLHPSAPHCWKLCFPEPQREPQHPSTLERVPGSFPSHPLLLPAGSHPEALGNFSCGSPHGPTRSPLSPMPGTSPAPGWPGWPAGLRLFTGHLTLRLPWLAGPSPSPQFPLGLPDSTLCSWLHIS